MFGVLFNFGKLLILPEFSLFYSFSPVFFPKTIFLLFELFFCLFNKLSYLKTSIELISNFMFLFSFSRVFTFFYLRDFEDFKQLFDLISGLFLFSLVYVGISSFSVNVFLMFLKEIKVVGLRKNA